MTEIAPGAGPSPATRQRHATDSAAPSSRSAVWATGAPRRDAAALALLLLLTAGATAVVTGDVSAYLRGDWSTFFLPMYAHLGERLRAFDLPGWNPSQFSGAPFAGDPESGWMYLPAMIVYALLPALPATTLFLALHLALSAVAAYLLARLTGLGVAAAFVAGVAYAFPWLLPAAGGAVLMSQVTTWLPVALIGVELARRAAAPSRRLAGPAVGGLAVSQILAAWLGQGAYYALLVIAGWVGWRTLVTPPAGWTVRARLTGVAGIGGGILLSGLALNAAALLVRLDANLRSNAPGGAYTGISGYVDTKTGAPLEEIARALVGGYSAASWQYVGAAVVALALLAPCLAPRWPPLPFWLLVAACAVALALPGSTVVRQVFYVALPRFALVHEHLPERILMLVPLAAAMLAGASADAACRGLARGGWRRLGTPLAMAGIALGAIALHRDDVISRGSLLAALAALAVVAATLATPAAVRPALLAAALAAIVIWDPAGRALAAGWGPRAGPERSLRAALQNDVGAFLFDNGAAKFLEGATRGVPGRYAGFDPVLLPDPQKHGGLPPQVYRNHWLGPPNWLLLQNWGTWFGLADVQGYNPIHVERYGAYIDALNGHGQEYHETDLFPSGLDSPLLAPLNLRYLVVPANVPDRADLAEALARYPVVYRDERVRVLENRTAFPRAWLLHEARQMAPPEVLPLLAAGKVDPARTALTEVPPPAVAAVPSGIREPVHYRRLDPDQAEIRLSAQADGLLLVSEVWDPGWTATVDGAPTEVVRANAIFQAIAVPGGDHLVRLRYDPPLLRVGMVGTMATALLLAAVEVTLLRRERRGSGRRMVNRNPTRHSLAAQAADAP